jgi:hypothetical protein
LASKSQFNGVGRLRTYIGFKFLGFRFPDWSLLLLAVQRPEIPVRLGAKILHPFRSGGHFPPRFHGRAFEFAARQVLLGASSIPASANMRCAVSQSPINRAKLGTFWPS